MNEDWSCIGEESKDPYTQICVEAVEDDDVFKKFKSDPRYTAILEHVPVEQGRFCLLYTSPSPRDLSTSRMPSSA